MSFEEELMELLDTAYAKGQAYYRKDNFGASEDDDQEWEVCYEEGFHDSKEAFIKKYKPTA